MNKIYRLRSALRMIAWLALAGLAPLANGQEPGRQSQVIVPVGAGGLNDQLARIMAERLAAGMQSHFVVVNKPGANGNIAATYVARSQPNGETLLLGSAQMSGSVTLYKSLNYSLEKDLAPIALLARTPYFLAVNADLPVKSVGDLIALARAKPNTVSFASTGVGSGGHLLGESFQQLAGVKLLHVPFNSAGQYSTELIAGRVDMVFAGLPIIKPHLQSGKLRVLAVTLPERSSFLPEVPTMRESGGPAMEDTAWFGLFAPSGTPKTLMETYERIARETVQDPKIMERLSAQGAIPGGEGPAAFSRRIHEDIQHKAAIIKAAGVPQQ